MINPITSKNPEPVELQWPDSFYKESNPRLRLKALEDHLADPSTPSSDLFIKKLFDLRYDLSDTKPVDNFMLAWVNMGISNVNGVNFINKRQVAKDWQEFMRYLGICPSPAKTEVERELLHKEWEAFFSMLIAMNRSDKTYSSVLFGVVPMKKDTLSTKIANELQALTYTVPKSLGFEEAFADFHKIAGETYSRAYVE